MNNLLSSQNHPEDDGVWYDRVETQEEDVLIEREINTQKKKNNYFAKNWKLTYHLIIKISQIKSKKYKIFIKYFLKCII